MTLDMKKDHKTQKNFLQWLQHHDYIWQTTIAPFVSKQHSPLLNSKRIGPHISEKWFGWTLTANLSQIICKPSIIDNHVHFKVFLLESNAKQEAYMKHTLTRELSTLSKNHWGYWKFCFTRNFQNLIFRPGIS